MANKGDTLKLFLNFKYNGQPIAEDDFEEMEFQILRAGVDGALTKTPTWDDTLNKYYISLSQSETFALPKNVRWQLRCLDSSSNVCSTNIGAFALGDVLSEEVLTND